MPSINFESELQKLLADKKLYDGPIDGELNSQLIVSIKALLAKNKIDSTGWSNARINVAGEQLLYQSKGIGVGKIDGLVGPQTLHARDVYEAQLVTTFKDVTDKVYPATFASSLADIDINQLAFIRGVGETETGFSKKEAYSEAYNQESNNANVREYGSDGADYGYYQTNALDVRDAIRRGVDAKIAYHLNGGGRDGTSTIEQQTIAMHEYLKRKYPSQYEAVKSGTTSAFEAMRRATQGQWFGLKDRPDDARKQFAKASSCDWTKIFPEVVKEPPVTVKVPSSKLIKPTWPKQADCMRYFGNVGKNQVMCQVPFTMVLAWDTNVKVKQYSCHRLVKEPMERIWNRTLEHYGYEKIVDLRLHYFGGCLNVRQMRGGSSWSMHSWGIAVDIDPDRNQLNMNRKEATLSKPVYDKFWQFVYDEGAISLGIERDYDWMHFQFARLA
jgi:hypothetical protein